MAGEKGKGKSRKLGRNSGKCKRYAANNTRAKNKIAQIMRSCGRAFAEKWANEYGHFVKVPQTLPR